MDKDVSKVFGFFGTKSGRLLLIIVAIAAAIYFGSRYLKKQVELEKYNGNTKSDIEDMIKSDFASWYIYKKLRPEIEADGKTFTEGMVRWYDENALVQIQANNIDETLRKLRLAPDLWADFRYLEGQKVILVPYMIQ